MNSKDKNLSIFDWLRKMDSRYFFNLINYKNEKNKIFVKSLNSLKEITELTIFDS